MNEEMKPLRTAKERRQGVVQLGFVIAFIVLAFVISAVLNAGKSTVEKRDSSNRAMVAEVQLSEPTNYRIEFSTTGVVQSRAEVDVVSQVTGRVVAVNDSFFSGGIFKPNERLFAIDPIDFKLEVQRLEAAVAQAQTSYNIEQAESSAAAEEWALINGEKAVPDLVARKPQREEAATNLKAAKAQLENAKLDLRRANFSLPFAGRVLSSTLEKGQFITAGQSYGRVYDIGKLEVQTSLEGKQLSWLLNTKNPDVIVQTTYLGEAKTYVAMLKRGVSELDTNTRFAKVAFGFNKAPKELIPGIFVDIAIKGPELENVTLIPSSSLQKGEVIWGVTDENTLYPIKGETVYTGESYIVLKGIEGPVRVVISKMPGAIEGMKVQLVDEPTVPEESVLSE